MVGQGYVQAKIKTRMLSEGIKFAGKFMHVNVMVNMTDTTFQRTALSLEQPSSTLLLLLMPTGLFPEVAPSTPAPKTTGVNPAPEARLSSHPPLKHT